MKPDAPECPTDGVHSRDTPIDSLQLSGVVSANGLGDALDKFSAVMVSLVLPITVVTLVAMVVWQQESRPGPHD
jgi:hypothetical protein